MDESGFMLQPLVRRTWARRGQTPVLRAWDRHDRLTAITALTLSPQRRRVGLFFQLQRHNAKAEDFVWFLYELWRELGRKLVVVWDRLGAHRRAERLLQELGCRWARFELLPAYSPELNPVEHVWSQAKYGDLCGWAAPHVLALQERVHASLDDQRAEQALLKAHFRWAGLELR